MKILVFNWRDMAHPEAGGAELCVFKTMEGLRKKGHDITFFVGSFNNAKKYDSYKGMRIIRSGNRFTTYFHAFLYYLLRPGKYDVVYDCVNGVPYWTPLFVRKKKVIYFFHVVGDIFFKQLPFPLSFVGYLAEKVFMPLFYRNQKFIVISKGTQNELSKLGIKKQNTQIIYCGLDHDKYKPGKKSKKPRIVLAARLKKYKRVLMLADIFKEIKKKVKDAEIYVMGDGEEYNLLEEKVKDIKDFHLHGFVGEKTKIEMMQSAWLNVSTSSKEGWGLTVLESNSCGVPSISFNVPGLNEAIVNGKTGYLVNNQKEFVDKCVKILKDNKLRKKLSENAIKWSKNFTWQNTSNENLDFIKNL